MPIRRGSNKIPDEDHLTGQDHGTYDRQGGHHTEESGDTVDQINKRSHINTDKEYPTIRPGTLERFTRPLEPNLRIAVPRDNQQRTPYSWFALPEPATH